jgi:hypothetical protein
MPGMPLPLGAILAVAMDLYGCGVDPVIIRVGAYKVNSAIDLQDRSLNEKFS